MLPIPILYYLYLGKGITYLLVSTGINPVINFDSVKFMMKNNIYV